MCRQASRCNRDDLPYRFVSMHLRKMNNEVKMKLRIFNFEESINSDVLNRKRKLTVEMIRKLTKRLNFSAELLINDYNLSNQ